MAKQEKQVRVTLTLPDGTRKYFSGRTRKEAEAKRDKAKLKLAGGWNIGSGITFAEMAEVWMEEYNAKKKIHQRSKETVKGIFDRYLIPELGAYRLTDIKPIHIDMLLTHMAHLSKSTQKKALNYAGAVFNKAVENEIIPRSPAFGKKPTAEDPEEVEPLTDEQCNILLQATAGTRAYLFILVCLYCGLRKGEALGLMWKDIDFVKKQMSVQRSVVYTLDNRDGVISDNMKTKAAHRVVPLSDSVVDVLKKEKEKSNSLYVFSMKNGHYLSESSFKRLWDIVRYRTVDGPAKSDRVEKTITFDVHPHQLRHTCCTRWIRSGMNPKEVQYLMGHASSKVTMDVYAAYQKELELEKTAKKIQDLNYNAAIS